MSEYGITPAYVLSITGEVVSQTLIDEAERVVDEHAGRNWRQTVTVTDELYSGDGCNVLLVKSFPLISVSALSIYDTAAEEWEALTAAELADLEFVQEIGKIIYIDGYFEVGNDNIKISYVYGVTAGVPGRVKTAIARVAAYLRANPLNASSESIGGISISHGGLDGILKMVPRRIKI